jgi:acyl-CoA reductase-like NAD-dependent aldehyde dehydrogenase
MKDNKPQRLFNYIKHSNWHQHLSREYATSPDIETRKAMQRAANKARHAWDKLTPQEQTEALLQIGERRSART